MSQNNDTFNPFDPTGMFKSMRDANMDAWSKMMIQLVNTDAYAQATGTMLDAWLTTSAPFRKALETAMTQVLTNLNMPTPRRRHQPGRAPDQHRDAAGRPGGQAGREPARRAQGRAGPKTKSGYGENQP